MSFNPLWLAWAKKKYGGGNTGGGDAGGNNDNIFWEGGVLSFSEDSINPRVSVKSEVAIKLHDEPIPLTRITEVYCDFWRWVDRTEEERATVRNFPFELDTSVTSDSDYEELWLADHNGEWVPLLFSVTADEARPDNAGVTLTKGLYWVSKLYYPTRIVVKPFNL